MFDLKQTLRERGSESFELFQKHVNPSFAKAMRIIGFDVPYTRGSGAYLWDAKGTRYIDCLSGFGQFGLGRNHHFREPLITFRHRPGGEIPPHPPLTKGG